MRYHYEPKEEYVLRNAMIFRPKNHPVYRQATLITLNGLGLCIIQQKYRAKTKVTYWHSVDEALMADIYDHPKFEAYFYSHAARPDEDGLYPTIPVRKVMWALRMKPLKKERWETTFDREFV